MASRDLGDRIGRLIEARCPDHRSVAAVLQCARCGGIFWARQAKLAELDQAART